MKKKQFRDLELEAILIAEGYIAAVRSGPNKFTLDNLSELMDTIYVAWCMGYDTKVDFEKMTFYVDLCRPKEYFQELEEFANTDLTPEKVRWLRKRGYLWNYGEHPEILNKWDYIGIPNIEKDEVLEPGKWDYLLADSEKEST